MSYVKKNSVLKTAQLITNLLLIVVIALFSGVLTVYCIKDYSNGFIFEYRVVLITTLLSILLIMTVVSIVFFLLKKDVVYKAVFSSLVLYLIFAVCFFIMLETGFLERINTVEALRQYVSSKGKWGSALYMLVQFLQVVVLPIPSLVTTLAGVAMFGPLKATIFSVIGIVLGSLVAFFIGRFLGYKVAVWMVGRDNLSKWLKKIKGKDKIILTAMFLLPLFPDDVLCFVAGLSSMSVLFFTIMIIFSRLVSITLTCYAVEGNIIPYDTWWGIMLWALFVVAVIIAFIYIYKNGEQLEEQIKSFFKRKVK